MTESIKHIRHPEFVKNISPEDAAKMDNVMQTIGEMFTGAPAHMRLHIITSVLASVAGGTPDPFETIELIAHSAHAGLRGMADLTPQGRMWPGPRVQIDCPPEMGKLSQDLNTAANRLLIIADAIPHHNDAAQVIVAVIARLALTFSDPSAFMDRFCDAMNRVESQLSVEPTVGHA